MSLTRPRSLTPAALAARRANALKSTGPRTVRGKARVGFNALKLGLHAARSAPLRQRLIRAGYDRREALYGRIRSRIAQTFGTFTPEERRWCDGLATQVRCLTIRPQERRAFARINLKTFRKQKSWILRTSSDQQIETGSSAGPAGNSDDFARANVPGWDRLNFGIRGPWRPSVCVSGCNGSDTGPWPGCGASCPRPGPESPACRKGLERRKGSRRLWRPWGTNRRLRGRTRFWSGLCAAACSGWRSRDLSRGTATA